MTDEPDQEPKPTQRTPKGFEIPVPSREDVLAAIRKVSEPDDTEKDEQRPSRPA